MDDAPGFVRPEEVRNRGEPGELSCLGDATLLIHAILAVAHATDEQPGLGRQEGDGEQSSDALAEAPEEPRHGWHGQASTHAAGALARIVR